MPPRPSQPSFAGRQCLVGDGAYQIASDAEMQRVSNKLRTALGLQTETISNEETKQNAKNSQFDFEATTDQNYIIYTLMIVNGR